MVLTWNNANSLLYDIMSKVGSGSICVAGVDECEGDSVCLKIGTQETGICRALCQRKGCPSGFGCIFTAFEGDFQPLCMPIPKSNNPVHKSEHRRFEFGIEDAVSGAQNALMVVLGIFFIYLLYSVAKTCFGNVDNGKQKRHKKQQPGDRSAFQPQGLYQTPGCPTCGIQFAQCNANNQPFTTPPPYNPQAFNPSNFRQV